MAKRVICRKGYRITAISPILEKIRQKEVSKLAVAKICGIPASSMADYFLQRCNFISEENYQKLLKVYGNSFPELKEVRKEKYQANFGVRKSKPRPQVPKVLPSKSSEEKEQVPDNVYKKALFASIFQDFLSLKERLDLLRKSGIKKDDINDILKPFGLQIATAEKSAPQEIRGIRIADILTSQNIIAVPAEKFTEKDLRVTKEMMKNLRRRIQLLIQLDDPKKADKLRQEMREELDELFLAIDSFSQLLGTAAADIIAMQRQAMKKMGKNLKGGI